MTNCNNTQIKIVIALLMFVKHKFGGQFFKINYIFIINILNMNDEQQMLR